MTIDGNGQVGGQFNNKITSPPTGLAVTPQGTTGAITYSYRVTAVNSIGETQASAPVSIANGNATLNGTNYNAISWAPSPGPPATTCTRGSEPTNIGSPMLLVPPTITRQHSRLPSTPGSSSPKSNTTAGRVLAICGYGWTMDNVENHQRGRARL
jgi:hypothetical protein